MKSINIKLPEKLRKKLKQWFLNFDDYTQNELLIWVVDNIPNKIPTFKQDKELLELLENPKNTKGLSQDKIITLTLIGKGVLKSDNDDMQLIDKLKKQ